jgi:hypothetical protein
VWGPTVHHRCGHYCSRMCCSRSVPSEPKGAILDRPQAFLSPLTFHVGGVRVESLGTGLEKGCKPSLLCSLRKSAMVPAYQSPSTIRFEGFHLFEGPLRMTYP